MSNDLRLYFLTVNYYSVSLITELLTSLKDIAIPSGFMIVNNSIDDHEIRNLKVNNVEVIEAGSNLGFGKACNIGLELIYRRSQNSIVWLINPDTYFLSEDLAKIPQVLTITQIYPIVGTLIYNQQGNITFSGGNFHHLLGTIGENTEPLDRDIKPTNWVSGCSMILHLQHFKECPQFDRDFFLYYEDFAFCQYYHKLQYPIVICGLIKVIHYGSSLTNKMKEAKLTQEICSYLLALAKHGSKLGLLYRISRIFLGGIGQTLINPPRGSAKLKGIGLFISRFFLAHS